MLFKAVSKELCEHELNFLGTDSKGSDGSRISQEEYERTKGNRDHDHKVDKDLVAEIGRKVPGSVAQGLQEK